MARALPGDSLEVGLLTCSPGTEVYALYGHTAIRVRSCAPGGEDWVFNYGLFSFNRPHFIWRFALGECDYQVGAVPYRYFAEEYAGRGSSVYQQTLNLTAEEKERLWALLLDNLRPENREYRYNFFYDNCTTRARDRIEDAVDGEIVYPAQDTACTFRGIVHQYTADYPWAELGDDICLGAAADRPISAREEMFAPFRMLRYADGAVIRGADGRERPLVLSTHEVVKGSGVEAAAEFPCRRRRARGCWWPWWRSSPSWSAGGVPAIGGSTCRSWRWQESSDWWSPSCSSFRPPHGGDKLAGLGVQSGAVVGDALGGLLRHQASKNGLSCLQCRRFNVFYDFFCVYTARFLRGRCTFGLGFVAAFMQLRGKLL